MAKQSGLGANLYLGAVDLSGDVGSVSSIASPRGVQVVTGLNKTAEERILTLRDGALAFAGFWNAAVGAVVPTLNALPRTDVLATVAIPSVAGSFAVGDPAASLLGKQIDLTTTRGADGSLVLNSQILGNGEALEWGQLLTTGMQTFATGTVNGTSIDFGDTDTDFGASAYLHVFSVGSGTSTFTVADSANDTDFTAVTGMAFTAATGATSERIETAVDATIRRYVRIQKTGVSTSTVAVVVFVRHLTSQAS